MSINESDFEIPSDTISVLEKSLHGGIVLEKRLTEEELHVCETVDWVEPVVKFKCRCGSPITPSWHTTPPDEVRCTRTETGVNPTEEKAGFRIRKNIKLDLDVDTDYSFDLTEDTSAVIPSEYPQKTIIFTPSVDDLEIGDNAGTVIFAPLTRLSDVFTEDPREDLISDSADIRKEIIDWEALDGGGEDFEEIIYRLVNRDDKYFNESWGGSGPDQGKDGFCSIDLGGPPTRVLIEAKGRLSDSLNEDDVRNYRRKARRHSCNGLIIAAIRTTGDLETAYENRVLHTDEVNYIQLWPGPKLKEKIAYYPDLISEFFAT